MNDVAKTAADMLRMGVEPSLEVEIELRAENDKLREQRDELLKALEDAEVALAHFESALHVRVNPPTLSNIQALITKIRGAA